MTRARILAALALACVGLTGGCPGGNTPPTIGHTRNAYSGGTTAQVNLLVRSLWLRGEEPPRGYGFYSYLMFLSNDRRSGAQRSAAARGFLAILSDARDRADLDESRRQYAVLLAPIRFPDRGRFRARDVDDEDVEVFLKLYDYDTARTLANRIETGGARLPETFLVGARRPLGDGGRARLSELTLVPLDGTTEAAAQEAIEGLADALYESAPAVRRDGSTAIDKALAYLSELARRFGGS